MLRRMLATIPVMLILFCIGTKLSFGTEKNLESEKIRVLIDADTNNELDDQHALAYAFMNRDIFKIAGITVNNTFSGNGIEGQYEEALRILKLFNIKDDIPLYKGAEGSYLDIQALVFQSNFDGKPAVDFIIQEAEKSEKDKLVILAIGKLTNVSLAIHKAPGIIPRIKVVWLGSNYPDPGEYNLVNDTSAVNPLIQSGVEFELVTVRYGQKSGTAAVTISKEQVLKDVKGKGPVAQTPIVGRHGGTFTRFGDYSWNLFEHIRTHGPQKERALFDMAAVAILKNPDWGKRTTIAAPKLDGKAWVPGEFNSSSRIVIWENFDRDAIIGDFIKSLNEE